MGALSIDGGDGMEGVGTRLTGGVPPVRQPNDIRYIRNGLGVSIATIGAELCGEDGGDKLGSRSILSTFTRSRFTSKNSGAVLVKNISFFVVINFNLGIVILCTKFPLMTNLISIVSIVKANT